MVEVDVETRPSAVQTTTVVLNRTVQVTPGYLILSCVVDKGHYHISLPCTSIRNAHEHMKRCAQVKRITQVVVLLISPLL